MSYLPLPQKAQRLRIYVSESDRWRGMSLSITLLETLKSHGLAGATLFRGHAGFGAHSRVHTTSIETLSLDLPVVIEVIDVPEKISAALEYVYPMVSEGLITLDEVQIVKYTHRFLNPLPSDRLVSEVMTRQVVTFNPDLAVQAAWQQMLSSSIKVMPVVDGQKHVLGIVTDEDMLERAGINHRLSLAVRLDDESLKKELQRLEDSTLRVKDVMSMPVSTVNDDQTLGMAAGRMVKEGLKRMPVVDHEGRLVGMLSRLDILRQATNKHPKAEPHRIPQGAARTVSDVMTGNIPMVGVDDNLGTIIDKFSQSNSNRLIVVDTEGKAVGLICDSDVVVRVQPEKRGSILEALRKIGKPPAGKETAFDLMSTGPLTAPPDLPVVDAIGKMLAESRKWLVVVGGDGRPLGLVNRRILLESVAEFKP